MNDSSRWSLDQDPHRDDGLARLLSAADQPPLGADVDWERLHDAITREGRLGWRSPSTPREWWDVLVQWRRMAAAASIAAMLATAALLWQSDSGDSDLAITDAAPESAALARVVAAYPDEAVLTSMLDQSRTDEFTSWDPQ
jgi:anti-sigma-K factor RskA